MPRKYPEVDFQDLHLGKLVDSIITEKGVEYSWVAKKLSISSTGLYHRIKSPTYADVYEIVRLSEVLGIDVLGLIYNELHKRLPEIFNYKIFHKSQPENIDMQLKIDQLQAEVKSLYDLVAVLKKNNSPS